ncbi:PIN domain-containing protein [Oceanobacillus indicireducens]|uniref:PIN domain-containing protein n=1 Tax=Oceanobacillus indicireducens TaxID=1004261 RepID=A0A918D306_9BACI|nr:PIN domain-containing protein [Oceanobacillus indicireducens]GGN61248.1 hypothetical protein GCM10007971_26130 [Oceanobacillus indicireducens]
MATEMWVDTNVIVRFLTNDHPKLSPIAKGIMQQVKEGKLILHVNPFVIGECVFVLQGKVYGFRRQDIAERLQRFLSVKGIECKDKTPLIQALKNYGRTNVDFADAYIPAYAKHMGPEKVMTFNVKDFRKVDAEVFSPEEVLGSFEE